MGKSMVVNGSNAGEDASGRYGIISSGVACPAKEYRRPYFDEKNVQYDCSQTYFWKNGGRASAIVRDDKKVLSHLLEKISRIFLCVGIPPHIKGYNYLREGIMLAVSSPEIMESVTKELYPAIGKLFCSSSSKVERAIRHAIEVAWSKGRRENFNALFGVKVYSENERPTNSEFIALIADKLIMESFLEQSL